MRTGKAGGAGQAEQVHYRPPAPPARIFLTALFPHPSFPPGRAGPGHGRNLGEFRSRTLAADYGAWAVELETLRRRIEARCRWMRSADARRAERG